MAKPKILIPLLGKQYETALLEKLITAGYNVTDLSEDDCFEDCYTNFCASSSTSSSIIIDIDNVSCITSIIRAVHMTVNRPKIILLTSLLTWCGESSHRTVDNLDRSFCSRVPLQCAMKAYGLENTLWNIASDVMEENNKTYFVGTGLLYGGSGWDFDCALRRSWDKSPITNCGETNQEFSLPFLHGPSYVRQNTLAVHIEDFLSGVLHFVENDSYSSPSYHALVDEIKDPNSVTQSYNCNMYHNCPLDSQGQIAIADEERKKSPLDPKILLMSANIFFRSKFTLFPETTCRTFSTVWDEYRAANHLVPFNLVFTGAPQCGQTEAAKHVSKILDIQYVDVGDSLKWILDSGFGVVGMGRRGSRDADTEDACKALVFLVSAKIMDGSRKGSTIVTELGLRSFIFTEAFIATLPPSLLRKCIAQRLHGCPRCRMKGFALDVWCTGALHQAPIALIGSAQDFQEVFPATILIPPSSSAGSSSEGAHSDLTLVVFQSDRKILLQRASSKFVDGKGTKDQVAALRALESRLDAYTVKLKETAHSGTEEGARSSETCYMNHEVIIDFVKVTGCRIASIAVSAQGCVEGTARHIVERVVPLSAPGRGPLPSTLPSPSSSLPSPQEGLGHARGTAPDNRVGAVNAGPASRSNPGSGATHSAEDGVGEEKNSQDLTWRINEGLAGLKEHEKAALVENCNELLQYLEVNVTPYLARSLIHIERTRPADPIQYLIDALEAQSRKNRQLAEAAALVEFRRVLLEAETSDPSGH